MKVKWKPVIGYEGLYEINNRGEILSLRRNIILKQRVNRGGYYYTGLSKNGKKRSFEVHRLVAMAFVDNEESKPFVNHKNGIKTDNKTKNLEWCTHSENIKHAYKIGTMRADGKYNGRYKGGV